MQYEAQTPTDYLSEIEDDWRKQKLLAIRALIRSKAANYAECISYKMLGYKDDKGIVFHLNAQKNFVGFYVGDIKKIDVDGCLLTGLDVGKGCIRIKKSTILKETQLEEFIDRTIVLRKQGKDIEC